jgi:hypothetical protein
MRRDTARALLTCLQLACPTFCERDDGGGGGGGPWQGLRGLRLRDQARRLEQLQELELERRMTRMRVEPALRVCRMPERHSLVLAPAEAWSSWSSG